MVLEQTLFFGPLIVFFVIIVINFKDNLTLAIGIGTIFGKLYLLMIHPRLDLCFSKEEKPFPEEHLDLKN